MPDYFATLWTVAHQAPRSMGFPRQEYWSGLPFPIPGDLPNPGIKPESPASSALAGRFFTTEPPGKPFSWERHLISLIIKWWHRCLLLRRMLVRCQEILRDMESVLAVRAHRMAEWKLEWVGTEKWTLLITLLGLSLLLGRPYLSGGFLGKCGIRRPEF